MAEPMLLSAGKLRIKGSEIRYDPPQSLTYRVEPGRPLLFQLHYAYEEESSERENCIVRFRVSPVGTQGKLHETTIADTPILKDEVQGVLEQSHPGVQGDESARFEIDAFYERRRWFGMRKTRNAIFQHQETFQLRTAAEAPPRKAAAKPVPSKAAPKPKRK